MLLVSSARHRRRNAARAHLWAYSGRQFAHRPAHCAYDELAAHVAGCQHIIRRGVAAVVEADARQQQTVSSCSWSTSKPAPTPRLQEHGRDPDVCCCGSARTGHRSMTLPDSSLCMVLSTYVPISDALPRPVTPRSSMPADGRPRTSQVDDWHIKYFVFSACAYGRASRRYRLGSTHGHAA